MASVPFVRRERVKRRRIDDSLLPRSGKGTGGFWFYLIPGFILFAIIILIPLVWNFYLSFTQWRGIKPPIFIGLDNWTALLQDAKFWTSFLNSIWMIVAMVIVPTLLGLLLAAMLFDLIGKKFGGRLASFLRATYYLPQILPIAVAAIVIGWILRPENGALNIVLEAVGLGEFQHDWLGSPDTALVSIMFVMIWVQLGYPVVIFMAALQRVDPELYEAAELDGAGWLQRFRAITVNIIRPRSSSSHSPALSRRSRSSGRSTSPDPRRARHRHHSAELLLVQRVLQKPAGGLRRHDRHGPHPGDRCARDHLHQGAKRRGTFGA